MGYTTEHRGRRPKVFVPGTGQFLNSTCIRTNQSNKDIRYSAILTERTRTLIDWNGKIKNKTAAECWNIVRGELDNAIDS